MMTSQEAGSQVDGHRFGQISQAPVAPAGTGQSHPQLGQPEDTGQERANDIDGLDPAQWQLPGVAPEQARLDPQGGTVKRPPRDEPFDEAHNHDYPEQRRLDDERGQVAAPAGRVFGQDQQQDHPDAPTHDDWRQWVQLLPPSHRRSQAQRPAAFASPSAARRSRRRAASACSRPGMRASLAAAAVCSFTVESLKNRSTGPAVTSTNCIRP